MIPTREISSPATGRRRWCAFSTFPGLPCLPRWSHFQVFHFMGHGDFDPATGEGSLRFEDERGGEAPVPGPVLAEHLKGVSSLRLAVLNACRSAEMPRQEGVDPYSGVASALVMGGLPAVVAMQLPLSDTASLAFAKHLYQTLAEATALGLAVSSPGWLR